MQYLDTCRNLFGFLLRNNAICYEKYDFWATVPVEACLLPITERKDEKNSLVLMY